MRDFKSLSKEEQERQLKAIREVCTDKWQKENRDRPLPTHSKFEGKPHDRYFVWYLRGDKKDPKCRRVVDQHRLRHFYSSVSKENQFKDGDKSYGHYPYHAEAHLVGLSDKEVERLNKTYQREESEVVADEGSLNYLVLRAQRGSVKAQNQIIEYFLPLFKEAAPFPKKLKGNKIDDYGTDEFIQGSVHHLIKLIYQHDFSSEFKPRVMAEARKRELNRKRDERRRPDSASNPSTVSFDEEREHADGTKYDLHAHLAPNELVEIGFHDVVNSNFNKKDADILHKMYVEGYTQAEIGRFYRVDQRTIGRKLLKLVKLLQKHNEVK